jgi:hypothetical protein
MVAQTPLDLEPLGAASPSSTAHGETKEPA